MHPHWVAHTGSATFPVRNKVFILICNAEGLVFPLDRKKPYQRLSSAAAEGSPLERRVRPRGRWTSTRVTNDWLGPETAESRRLPKPKGYLDQSYEVAIVSVMGTKKVVTNGCIMHKSCLSCGPTIVAATLSNRVYLCNE